MRPSAGSSSIPPADALGLCVWGQKLGSDSLQLSLYLAAAIADKRTRADVEPAWHDYLRALPDALGGVHESVAGLMLAARVVYSVIGDVDEKNVAAEMRKLLRPSARDRKS